MHPAFVAACAAPFLLRPASIDGNHGSLSAARYKKDGGKSGVTEYLIAAHCVEPEQAERILNEHVGPVARERARKLLDIFMDADALDRVRFGIAQPFASDGLDLNYIKTESAKRLCPVALSCLTNLKL